MLVTSDEAPIPTGSPDAPETAIPDNAPFPEGHALLHSIQDSAQTKQKRGFTFKGRHSLIINERTLTSSIYALRFGVFADAVNSTILQPNFPFLVVPDLFKDSFPSTEPFGQAAAMYFLPMTAFLGTSISSTFIRYLSDKQGRRPWILACLGVGAIGSVVKYLVRGNFWTFCAANFVNGLFGASLPVAMVYVSDVKNNRKEKDEEIGCMIAFNMIGTAGGGMVAILIGSGPDANLFSPLWIGTALSTFATVLAYAYLVEPKRMLHLKAANQSPSEQEQQEFEESSAPQSVHLLQASNVLAGAVADNFGSAGL